MARLRKSDRDARLKYIVEQRSLGLFPFQIVQLCMKEWGVKKRMAERYLQWVDIFLRNELTKEDKDYILTEYKAMALRMELCGDRQLAYLYRKQRDKIMGLEQSKLNITGTIETIKTIILKEKGMSASNG